MKKFKLTSSANGKVFRSGVYSTAILAAAIVLAVLLNLLVGALPKKYTEFDLSEAKMYTLGDSSKKLVQSLDQDVTVYYLCETGSEDAILTKLLDHYADESSHFRWEQKDPAIYPTFAAQYGASDVSTGSLIVVSGENNVVLDAADLYEYDYSDYYTTGSANVTFGGEKQITSAIYKLTAAEETHAYYTTNHGEQALTSSLTEALEAQNITAQPLDLLTSTIPDDCDLLIINDPTSDFASDGWWMRSPSCRPTWRTAAGCCSPQTATTRRRIWTPLWRSSALPGKRALWWKATATMPCTATRTRCSRTTAPPTKAPRWTA